MKKFTDKEIEKIIDEYTLKYNILDIVKENEFGNGFEAGFKKALELIEKKQIFYDGLHKALNKLIADYIEHHSFEVRFKEMPLIELMNWSFTQNPDKKVKK